MQMCTPFLHSAPREMQPSRFHAKQMRLPYFAMELNSNSYLGIEMKGLPLPLLLPFLTLKVLIGSTT